MARAFRGALQAPRRIHVLYIRGRSSCRQKGPRAATSGPRVPTKLLFLHRGAKMFTALARRRYEHREGGEGDGGGARCSASVSYD